MYLHKTDFEKLTHITDDMTYPLIPDFDNLKIFRGIEYQRQTPNVFQTLASRRQSGISITRMEEIKKNQYSIFLVIILSVAI